MNDFENQVFFVVESIERILSQIDFDPISPTHGCAHLAFWRDKTSDVADMRRQEIMLPLALLFSRDYPFSSWKGDKRLFAAVSCLLDFWCSQQYDDGSMDEWYKGERAFAAPAFSTHAVARTLDIMDQALPLSLKERAREKLTKTACWLMSRDDLFKTNHQAVGVAALAWAAHVTGKKAFKQNARKKLESIIAIQTREGWFPEIGHMDVGYTFLTVEFICLIMDLWDDWEHAPVFCKAFEFACELVHPDLTAGEEYGVCHNPYLSRIAIMLMARFSGRAAYMWERLKQDSTGFSGLAPTMGDDLRLFRWAWQPLLAYDYSRQMDGFETARPKAIALSDPSQPSRTFDSAGVARFSCAGGTGVFSPVSGGLLRLFSPNGVKTLADAGYAIASAKGYASNITYAPGLEFEHTKDGFFGEWPLVLVKKFMPPYWARVCLHLACGTAAGSKLTRKAIDIYRKRKGTSVNQASANLRSATSLGKLSRRVIFEKDSVVVFDHLDFTAKISRENLYSVEIQEGGHPKLIQLADMLEGLPEHLKDLTVRKVYIFQNKWRVDKIKASARTSGVA